MPKAVCCTCVDFLQIDPVAQTLQLLAPLPEAVVGLLKRLVAQLRSASAIMVISYQNAAPLLSAKGEVMQDVASAWLQFGEDLAA